MGELTVESAPEVRGAQFRVKPVLAVVVTFLALLGSIVALLHDVLSPSPVDRFADWQVYHLAGRAIIHGSDLYAFRSSHNAPFTYPPLAAILFIPFAGCPITAGGLIMAAATLGALAAIVVMLVRYATPASLPWILLGCAVAVQLQAVESNVFFGQINLILGALIVADLLLPHPPWPRGMAIGLTTAIKLTPALFIVYLLVTKQYRTARTATVTTTGLTALTWVALPGASRTYWFHALWETGRVGPTDGPRNRSIWGLVLRMHLPGPLGHLVLAAAALGFLVFVMIRARRAERAGDILLALILVGFLGCLLSPITWSHHVVWMIPAGALLLYRRTWGTWPTVAVIVVLSTPLVHVLPGLIGRQVVAEQTILVVLLVSLLPIKASQTVVGQTD